MKESIQTHHRIDQNLCGKPVLIEEGHCRVELTATADMTADESGLVHGGFIFGLADYAAMLSVNHPNVVLGSAEVKFLKPVKAGETVVADARITETSGRKQIVHVIAERRTEPVFEGDFSCFVLEKHVLGAS